MSDYRQYMTESQKLEAQNLAMRSGLAKQADEALHDAAVWMRRAIDAEEKLAECLNQIYGPTGIAWKQTALERLEVIRKRDARIKDLEDRLRAAEEKAIRIGWDRDAANAEIIRLTKEMR